MLKTLKHVGQALLLVLCVITNEANGQSSTLKVIELDDAGDIIGTHEIKRSPLVVNDGLGKKVLNAQQSNLQEAKVRELLAANFVFKDVCRYNEWNELKKKNVDRNYKIKPERLGYWYAHHEQIAKKERDDHNRPYTGLFPQEMDEVIHSYAVEQNGLPKNHENCFAEELEKLLSSHKCLAEKAEIRFYIKPQYVAEFHNNNRNDDLRRIVKIRIIGCPVAGETIQGCFWKRTQESESFMTPPAFRDFAQTCGDLFKDPEIKRMADKIAPPSDKHSAR